MEEKTILPEKSHSPRTKKISLILITSIWEDVQSCNYNPFSQEYYILKNYVPKDYAALNYVRTKGLRRLIISCVPRLWETFET